MSSWRIMHGEHVIRDYGEDHQAAMELANLLNEVLDTDEEFEGRHHEPRFKAVESEDTQ